MNNRVKEAFGKVKREYFVPDKYQGLAQADMPLPIGYGQTISQPTTVRLMLEWLDVKEGDKVLDVGSGSGWTTALLAFLTGLRGKVYAVERIPKLLEMGHHNCDKIALKNAQFYPAENGLGLEEFAPYERILVSASADRLPEELLSQLKEGGKMVIPVQNAVLEITKNKEIKIVKHRGFVFVPLI